MNDPIIKARDIAWIRLQSPDLDQAETFLTDFGLQKAERTEAALYMRGTDAEHHLHVTELGPPKVIGVAFHANSASDLDRLADKGDGASDVEDINEPGGGKRVRLTSHNVFQIEVVHGLDQVSALPVERQLMNTGSARVRQGEYMRTDVQPSLVKRIGHAVFSTPEVRPSVDWAHRHLGFKPTEMVHAEDDEDDVLACFIHADRGSDYTDHHTMMFGKHTKNGLNHVSFEVQDLDDLWAGHDYLSEKEYDHCWGIGRHLLGSQIFDYWFDPWGRMHEHWTDSDLVNDQHVYQFVPRSRGLRSQWGPQAPQAFRDAASV
ncbi:MAG: VOC family protein [Rhodospirillaceae bacterium]